MHADFKVTCWERVTIPPELEEEFLQKVKDGIIETAEDCFRQLSSNDLECTQLIETSECMTSEFNDGNPVMEILDDKDKTIYDNINGFYVKEDTSP